MHVHVHACARTCMCTYTLAIQYHYKRKQLNNNCSGAVSNTAVSSAAVSSAAISLETRPPPLYSKQDFSAQHVIRTHIVCQVCGYHIYVLLPLQLYYLADQINLVGLTRSVSLCNYYIM